MNDFLIRQRELQTAFRARMHGSPTDGFPTAGSTRGRWRHRNYPFILPAACWEENLFAGIRAQATSYFQSRNIAWHLHRANLLSSQICCLNFLMPFATRARALAALLRPVIGDGAQMIAFDAGPTGDLVYVAFEWIGGDYLNERGGRERRRGANCTSADAAVMFRRAGRTEMLLIEWKYTESYGAALRGGATARDERLGRYGKLAFAPGGPLQRASDFTVSDLFFEPFYQLLRQQVLAFQLQLHRDLGCERVSVLHIAPSQNRALRKVTAPKLAGRGADAMEVWRGLLVDRDAFMSISTEALFGAFEVHAHRDLQPWRSYVGERYRTLLPA
jgi:hypothetical protein